MGTTDTALRIAFVGASGTGKTTLARAVAARFDLPMNPVGSRSVAEEMGFSSPYDVDSASWATYDDCIKDGQEPAKAAVYAMEDYEDGTPTCRTAFQTHLQMAKIEWERETKRFVSDRTTIDDFCYTAMHAPESLTKEFEARAKDHLGIYNVILHTPMDTFIRTGDDPSRLHNLTYHRAFEFMCVGAIDQWSPDNTYFLDRPGIDERIKMIVDLVNKLE